MVDRLHKEATGVRAVATVAKHGAGWRARVQGANQVNGPTRQCKAAADVDASQLQAALQISAKELQSVVQRLHIRALSFCGQVLFRSCIVIGPVTLGQARLSS